MLASKMKLEDLPLEILRGCFTYLKHTRGDLQNLRLVSKRLHDVSSEFLIESSRVCIISESLQRLEKLSYHPAFSKSIKMVEIIVSYFDAAIATDRGVFVSQCVKMLSENCIWSTEKE
jgi:hypothetical protein